MIEQVPCSMQKLIDRHFAGRICASDERTLRTHLPACPECRGYYQRHLLLTELDPQALDPRERLARSLGFKTRRFWQPHFVVPVAVSCVAALLLFVFLWPSATPDTPKFSTRGGEMQAAPVGLLVYRVPPGQAPEAAPDEIHAHDALAFAYQNRAGMKRLLVFGIDEHHNVYWYHPAWKNAEENPVAVPIEAGDLVRELPEAVTQVLRGDKLTLHGVFVNRPVSVREIEGLVTDKRKPSTSLQIPDAHVVSAGLKVQH